MKKITVRLDDELHKKIKKILIDKDLTFQKYIEMKIDEEIKKNITK